MNFKCITILLTFFLAIVATLYTPKTLANHFSYISDASDSTIQMIFCSDVHFGIKKANFRGEMDITSAKVNAAMVAQMNNLPLMLLPNDNGVSAGKRINDIDAVIITGDLCNRQEKGIQSASVSWQQFKSDYVDGLHLLDDSGKKTKLLLTPGNHDISDAIGYEKPMEPLTDNASLVGIYNMMMQPNISKTADSYNYKTDKIHYSINEKGVHLIFVDAWPDSAERAWMEKDLAEIKSTTPVFLFTHSMPDVEARFFINPNGDHTVNATDKFENLVAEMFKDGNSIADSAVIEQRAFAQFIKKHPNIKGYFHGHNNYTEFYDWKGPDNDIILPCFRVDSPMKGKYSSKNETLLSFELITIDPNKKIMTVREIFWNAHPTQSSQIDWGASRTISLK